MPATKLQPTQAETVIGFLREHPRSTSFEIAVACGISNVTGAIHKARGLGTNIVCEVRDRDYRRAYRIVDGDEPRAMPPDWIARHPRRRSTRTHRGSQS